MVPKSGLQGPGDPHIKEENYMSTANPFEKTSGVPTLSYSYRDENGKLQNKPFGTTYGGTVSKAPEVVQSTGYEGDYKGKKLFWDVTKQGAKTDQAKAADGRDNNPVNQIVVRFSDAGEDGSEAAMWVSYYPKDQLEAIQEALNGRAIEPGDKLFVTLTGLRPIPGKNPAYTYVAKFEKGQGVFAPAAAAASSPAPAGPAGPAPAPAPAPAAPAADVQVDGYTLAQYLSSGWDVAGLKADGRFGAFFPAPAPAPAAPAPAAPAPAGPAGPAGPPAPAASSATTIKREDLALLGVTEAEVLAKGWVITD